MPSKSSEYHLISNSRRRTKRSTGFVIELATAFPVGTLVELDLAFPGQSIKYRARGMISWISEGKDPARPYKVWILISKMEKLSPSGATVMMHGSGAAKQQPLPDMSNQAAQQVAAPATQQIAAPAAQQIAAPVVQQASIPAAAPVDDSASTSPDTGLEPPDGKDLAELLTSLVGEDVEVTKIDSAPLGQEDFIAVGDFIGDDSTLLDICALDAALANWLGAALAMIPKAAVEKDVKARRLSSDEIKENIQEIFNISISMFNKPDAPHHRFNQLYTPFSKSLPNEVQALVDNPVVRADFQVEVPKYGSGKFCYIGGSTGAPPAEQQDSGQQAPSPEPPSADAPPAEQEDSVEEKSARKLPGSDDISELLTNLVGAEVNVKKTDRAPLEQSSFTAVGDFIGDDDALLAICVLDAALANRLGAALAMIPKAAVEGDIKAKRISSDEIKENVQEIFNISTSVFNKPEAPHYRFNRLYTPPADELPDNVQAFVDSPAARADFEVEIPGYGTGVICYFTGWA